MGGLGRQVEPLSRPIWAGVGAREGMEASQRHIVSLSEISVGLGMGK